MDTRTTDSFTEAAQFTYNPSSNQESEDSFSGILEIHVHHARNIQNICIYENQDVYAKFSLTYDPDETLSTRVIDGGGKNPEFNEDLIMKVHKADAVMKCEVWMLSRVKNYMDDQLLGFALVPVSSVSGKGKVTQDFDLSSTDLFHSPAGTIKLSLSLSSRTPLDVPFSDSVVDSCPPTSELLVDKEIPDEYCRVEFPDMNVLSENKQMVSEYFARNGRGLLRPWLGKPDGSFLHLGALPIEDCDMGGVNSPYKYLRGSVSPDGSIHNSCFLSSAMTSFSEDRNSVDSAENKGRLFADHSTTPDENASPSRFIVETPTLEVKCEAVEEIGPGFSGNEDESNRNKTINTRPVGLVRSVKLEAEEFVMQKQIVDMYMKSMKQFTESLANMKLPMDLDKPGIDSQVELVHNPDENIEIESTKAKKDNSRVFYGSRAFF